MRNNVKSVYKPRNLIDTEKYQCANYERNENTHRIALAHITYNAPRNARQQEAEQTYTQQQRNHHWKSINLDLRHRKIKSQQISHTHSTQHNGQVDEQHYPAGRIAFVKVKFEHDG